jgi:hypothetical protein
MEVLTLRQWRALACVLAGIPGSLSFLVKQPGGLGYILHSNQVLQDQGGGWSGGGMGGGGGPPLGGLSASP